MCSGTKRQMFPHYAVFKNVSKFLTNLAFTEKYANFY